MLIKLQSRELEGLGEGELLKAGGSASTDSVSDCRYLLGRREAKT